MIIYKKIMIGNNKMELTLKKVSTYGEDKTKALITISVTYAGENEMLTDLIKINFIGAKKETYLTVKAKNPVIGAVIERIIKSLEDIHFINSSNLVYPQVIIEELATDMGLQFDKEIVKVGLKDYNITV